MLPTELQHKSNSSRTISISHECVQNKEIDKEGTLRVHIPDTFSVQIYDHIMALISDCKSQSSKDETIEDEIELKISKELFEIITAWDDLPNTIQEGILAMIRSINKGKTCTNILLNSVMI